MSINNYGDAFGRGPGDRLQRLSERPLPRDAKHLRMFSRPLLADAGFDQYSILARVDEHTVHVHSDAVLFIRRTYARPESARHDSKHRTAIKTKLGVGDYLYAVITKLHCNFVTPTNRMVTFLCVY